MAKKLFNKVNKYSIGSWLNKNGDKLAAGIGLASNVVDSIQQGLAGNKEAEAATESGINQVNNTTFNAGNTSNIMSQWSSANYMDPVTYKDFMSTDATSILSGAASGASTGASFGGIGAGVGAGIGAVGGLFGWLFGRARAKKKAKKYNEQIALANDRLDRNLESSVANLEEQQLNNALMNYAAYGGPLETNGITWPSDLVYINNGGTHEENPNEGVQLGVDSEGVPNLVEEGEIIYNDYVFSNRLKVPKKDIKDLKLGNKDITFADAVEKLAKESEERPNDPISKLGLEANLNKLIVSQEGVRNKSNKNRGNKFALGSWINEDELYSEEDNILENIAGKNNGLVKHEKLDKSFLGVPVVTHNVKIPTPTVTTSATKKIKYGISQDLWRRAEAAKKNKNNGEFNWQSLLRYAPVVGNAIGLLSNKENYANADALARAINNLPTIGFNPLGDYLTYNPLDVNYQVNKLNAQAAANRRAIANTNYGNRGMANAALLAADLNAQTAIGDAYRQATEYNQGLKERVAAFNRGTNQVNSQMGLQADMANADIKQSALNAKIKELAMRDSERNRYEDARNANLTSLFDNLGAIGKEQQMIDMFNNNPALLYKVITGEYKAACGGKIKRRRK